VGVCDLAKRSIQTMIRGAWLSWPVFSRHGIFFWLLLHTVRIRYTFFLTSVLLGLAARSMPLLLVWMLAQAAAILIHELGHARVARYYGHDASIELHAMGGMTSYSGGFLQWQQRALISLAGPAAGFLAGGLVYGVGTMISPGRTSYLLRVAVGDFLWVTLGWGLLNLVPILPLDGGSALGALLEWRLGATRGRFTIRLVSVLVGVAALFLALSAGWTWAAVLCALLAWNNFQRMRGLRELSLPR